MKHRTATIAVCGVIAAACWLLVGAIGAVPGYDASWHLIWGDQLLHGHMPDVDAWAAPTEHPLLLLIAMACSLAGSHASQLLITITLLAMIATAPALSRVAKESFGSSASGIVGWVALTGGYGLLLMALRGYLDVWFLLFVSVAAASVLAGQLGYAALPLALAGLLRPEAWVLCAMVLALTWTRATRVERAVLLAAATLPAVVWLSLDAIMSNDPLLSLKTARTLALEDGGGALSVLATSLFGGIRGPVTLAGAVGALMAVRLRGLERTALPLAIGALGVGIAVLISIGGLSLLPRYLLLADLSLSLFCGFAIAGWKTSAQPNAAMRRWRIAGICAGALAVLLALTGGAVGKLRSEVALDRDVHSALQAILSNDATREGLRCGPLTFPSFRLIPDARLMLGGSQQVRGRAQPPIAASGVAVTVRSSDSRVVARYEHPGIRLPVDGNVPAGFTRVAGSGPFVAWAKCPVAGSAGER